MSRRPRKPGPRIRFRHLARRLGYLLFVLTAFCFSPFSRKLRRALLGRIGLAARIRAWRKAHSGQPLWFHVSSSGELEQCLPILDGLRARYPGHPIFVTVFSPSGYRAIELETERRRAAGRALAWDGADYAPFDFRFSARAFVEALDPACFVAIHREMWPGLLAECERRAIPAFLFAAYFPPRAHGSFGFYRELAEHFAFIGTVEAGSARFLRSELASDVPVESVGDPRIERVLNRRELSREASWASALRGRPVLIGASLWEADFRNLAPALARMLKEFPDWRLVLVPHEPESALVGQIERWLAERGQPARRWSDWSASPENSSHLIVDRVGLLAELYAAADLVFVGGSFRARVHNVLEPAAYARPILTGPYIHNSREAQELAEEKQALFAAGTADALCARLLELVGDQRQRLRAARAALDYLEQRQGAAAIYVERLADHLSLHRLDG